MPELTSKSIKLVVKVKKKMLGCEKKLDVRKSPTLVLSNPIMS
jgi:hypothetical protein